MFTTRFIVTIGLILGVAALIVLGVNQAYLQQQVSILTTEQKGMLNRYVVVTPAPTVAPTATPTATLRFVPRVSPTQTVK